MSKIKIIEAFSNLDDDLVENHFKQKEALKKKTEVLKTKKEKRIWTKRGAIVACFLLVISCIALPLLNTESPTGGQSLLVLTAYAADGTENNMTLNQGYLSSGISDGNIFGKDMPTFKFYVTLAERSGSYEIFNQYEIEISYNGKIVDGKDEHIRLAFEVPPHGVDGVARYCIIGWFDEITDIQVLLKDKDTEKIVETLIVNVSFSEEEKAYQLMLTE